MTTAITLHELDAESVELLPARETLCGAYRHSGTTQSQSNFQLIGLNNVANNNNFLNLGWSSDSGNSGNYSG